MRLQPLHVVIATTALSIVASAGRTEIAAVRDDSRSAGQQVCEVTKKLRDVGNFDSKRIDEASGLALTGSSFFVTNDSGDGPRFFRTALDGSRIEEFRIPGWKPWDVEDLSVGPCPAPLFGECVALADIGDNRSRRRAVEISFLEVDRLKLPDRPLRFGKSVRFRYPDGPRNAEAFAILNADFGVIVSKEQDAKSRASQPAAVYLVDFRSARAAKVATWDVPTWVRDQGLAGLVTGMAVTKPITKPLSPPPSKAGPTLENRRLLLLTYRDVIELSVEFSLPASRSEWPPRPWSVRSRTLMKVDPLIQQEAVSYDQSERGFYYTTEVPFAMLGVSSAPIRHVESTECP